MVSGFTFKSLIHFELIFVSSVRQESSFILLHVDIHVFLFSQIHHPPTSRRFPPLVSIRLFSTYPRFSNTVNRRLSFPHLCSWYPCQRLIDCTCVGLFLGFLFCSTGLCVCFYGSTMTFKSVCWGEGHFSNQEVGYHCVSPAVHRLLEAILPP